MDREKYNKILSICQLKQDLQIFHKGDQTEIGEKGVNLSGGQKARLAIARAVYNDSDIYAFDDPLSSLDAYVGMNLFNQVFNDYLKEKTIIISTHALQYVAFFDKVYYINQGEIKFCGKPDELEKQDFYQEFKVAKERNCSNRNTLRLASFMEIGFEQAKLRVLIWLISTCIPVLLCVIFTSPSSSNVQPLSNVTAI